MISEEMGTRIKQLGRKIGRENASMLLNVLGKEKSFVTAIETSVGQELVKDIVSSMDRIVRVILDEKDDINDRAELRAYRSILHRWEGRIKSFNSKHQEFIEKSQ